MAEAVLTVQLENNNGVQLIRVAGPLDSVTHDQFRSQLDPLVNESGVRLVLDCTNLTYVNSKGLALLGRYQQITMKNLSFFGVAGLNKRITKLKDQALELQKYEEKIHHLADQMIEIDLDDGVKVNYAKFQDVLEKIK